MTLKFLFFHNNFEIETVLKVSELKDFPIPDFKLKYNRNKFKITNLL
jgi:hypothetical protein